MRLEIWRDKLIPDMYLNPNEANAMLYDGIRDNKKNIVEVFEHFLKFGEGTKYSLDYASVSNGIYIEGVTFDNMIPKPNYGVCLRGGGAVYFSFEIDGEWTYSCVDEIEYYEATRIWKSTLF